MSSNDYPLNPPPWKIRGDPNPDLARLLDAAWRHRRHLALFYPWIPVMPARVYSQSTGKYGPYPAGAMVHLWSHWSFFRGTCPRCSGAALGYAFGGYLSRGHVHGICLGCAARWSG